MECSPERRASALQMPEQPGRDLPQPRGTVGRTCASASPWVWLETARPCSRPHPTSSELPAVAARQGRSVFPAGCHKPDHGSGDRQTQDHTRPPRAGHRCHEWQKQHYYRGCHNNWYETVPSRFFILALLDIAVWANGRTPPISSGAKSSPTVLNANCVTNLTSNCPECPVALLRFF